MVETVLTADGVWENLKTVKDPEVPALSIVDLKIVRNVRVDNDEVEVEITPTFVGCPALDMIAGMIGENLRSMGFRNVRVMKTFTAHWSTDMLDQAAKDNLKAFGIAPPAPSGEVTMELPTICPYCDSADTKLENAFGATLCKQLYYCNSCRQSFEKFRTL